MKRVAVIGARGYVGSELLGLLHGHPGFSIDAVSSRALAGKRLADAFGLGGQDGEILIEALSPESLAARAPDVCVLALPNTLAAPWVQALDEAAAQQPVIVDLSADYRFDEDWYYGLPELTRTRYEGERHISNPGCYATGAQLAIAPLLGNLAQRPSIFGVSGYSGAGTRPSRRNDTAALADNLMPYALTDHIHEREISTHLSTRVWFTPHVASFFRGISLTVMLPLRRPMTREQLRDCFARRYEGEPLIRIQDDIPEVADAANAHCVTIGGFAIGEGGSQAVVVATLDNLLKGAATQALQNMNLACGYPEFEGITDA